METPADLGGGDHLSDVDPEPTGSARELASGDKLVHFGLYFGFGFLLARAVLVESSPTFAVLATVAVGLIIAAIDEWHQQFIPGRSMDIADWRADAVGVALGVIVAAAANVAARRRTVVKPPAKL